MFDYDVCFFFQAEDGIRDLVRSRGLGDVYKRQKLPYYRLPGLGKIKNNDVVVFNYPMEDFRPVDKQENYIKRCVAIPGDTLQAVSYTHLTLPTSDLV